MDTDFYRYCRDAYIPGIREGVEELKKGMIKKSSLEDKVQIGSITADIPSILEIMERNNHQTKEILYHLFRCTQNIQLNCFF